MSAEFGARLQTLVEGPALEGRKAALLLHSLSEQDRGWVLDRLAPSQKAEMEALLAELRSLQVPVQPDLVHTLVPDVAPKAMPLQGLAGVPAATVHDLLAGEPARLVALALQLGPASWSSDSRARHLRRGGEASHAELPGALAAALQEVLAQRVQAHQLQAAARLHTQGSLLTQGRQRWWARLWHSVRRSA
ncbi:MAG TPA: hypothetical protein PK170_00035 [Anaerolineae bacterium]|nr:hypothetical protein [Anaerolineae bacterium]